MNQRTLPPAGTFLARRNGATVTKEADSGALCLYIPVILLSAHVSWQGKHVMTIGKSSGELQLRTIDNLRKVFPDWNPAENIFGIDDIPLPEDPQAAEFEVVGDLEMFTPQPSEHDQNPEERQIWKIQWLNPIGGAANMPEPVSDRKAVAAKWGSKLKAVAGGTKPAATKAAAPKPATPAAEPTPAPAPAKRPAASGPPSRKSNATSVTPRTSSDTEVWDALNVAYPNDNSDELSQRYWGAADEVAPNANGTLTPAQWGEVATKLGV